mmetsp:Transcript_41722/g.73321  ORF Transcript_41722/g.73321 Transcript_41722/m.73321 type:complete len:209 (+) Transcript_41722:1111-1737(+)
MIPVFVAMSSSFSSIIVSYSVFLFASVDVAVSRSELKVSYMSPMMPWTVTDCGLYLDCTAVAPVVNSLRSAICFSESAARIGNALIAALTALLAVACSWRSAEPSPFKSVAFLRTIIACSKAANACIISVLSAMYWVFSFWRMEVNSACSSLVFLISAFFSAISEVRVATWPFNVRIFWANSRISAVCVPIAIALLLVAFSHQHANLS